MSQTEYLTVADEAVAEFTEKRSRFMGAIRPVTDEAAALAFIRQKQKTYWDATHNVYAYVLQGGQLCRFSDDGEPQGTAGLPVLDVLRKEGLTDCVAVVTRYFGGILLGGGGLVRAYSHAAKLAVDAAGVVAMRLCAVGEIVCDYSQYGWLPALLAEVGAALTGTAFGTAVTVTFSIPQDGCARVQAALAERSNGRLEATFTGTQFSPFPRTGGEG